MTQQRKAIILLDEGVENRGEVINIVICSDYGIAGMRLPINQTIWDCTFVDATIGDRFEDGIFTRNGEEVALLETAERKVEALSMQVESTQAQVAYIGMMTEVL